MNNKLLEHPDKLRGGYYTPAPLARFLVGWGLQDPPRSVLEPACGDGALLRPLLEASRCPARLDAAELCPEAADAVEPVLTALRARGVDARLHRIDTLNPPPGALPDAVDLVLGNPPYIRYQYVAPAVAAGGRRVVEAAGLRFTRHTNAWMPFLLDGLSRLAPGGRLAMVLPAELLQVAYAAPLREHLLRQPLELELLTFRSLLFPGLSQEVVLLLARRVAQGPARLRLHPLRDAEELAGWTPGPGLGRPPPPDTKWTVSLLREPARRAEERLAQLPRFDSLATVCVGVVTGANPFFCADSATVAAHGLGPVARPLLGRSAQVPGLCFTPEDHARSAARGERAWLIHLPAQDEHTLPAAWQDWLALGRAQGLPLRFKCRIRSPWYSLPSVYTAPLALFKRSDLAPRLVHNTAEALSTDTAYRVAPRRPGAEPTLAVGFCSSATALSAELCGRSYGGGVLELVPSEIRRLRLAPGPAALFPPLDALLRARAPAEELHALVDPVVLGEGLGLDLAEQAAVQDAWRQLCQRRRGRRAPVVARQPLSSKFAG